MNLFSRIIKEKSMDHPAITRYLLKKNIDRQQVIWMAATVNGQIIDSGNAKSLLGVAVEKGRAEDYIAALAGLFPIKDNICLYNKQVVNNEYHNIHLLVLENKVWILLTDVNDENKKLKKPVNYQHERDQINEQLKATKDQLNDLIILKDQFVSIVSHDFRSPITTLINGISYLIEDMETKSSFSEINRDIIINIKSELNRLLDYNNKLYEWTKYSFDQFEVHYELISIEHLVMNLQLQFETKLKEKAITFNPVITSVTDLYTDITLLQLALINLIDNAIKFSSNGQEISLIIDGDSITIIDKGTGISNEQINEIKKGYYMESKLGTNNEPGTGVGLSIVTKILKTLGCSFNIQSQIGKGSTFTITFNRKS